MKLILNKKDRICFLGDSITADGRWIAEIFEYFVKTKPELEIGFFNCGIAGSIANDTQKKNRLYMDCFNFFPKYVVVMFGMNDCRRHLYSSDFEIDDREKQKAEAFDIYTQSIEYIINECKSNGAIPILCVPTPYDEYNDSPDINLHADKALEKCKDIVLKIAKRYGLDTIDFREILLEHMSERPINADRVHPNDFGHHLMAECFLKAIGEKSEIEMDSPVVLCKKNIKRYEAEQKERGLMFVDYNGMGWQNQDSMPITDRKAKLEERIPQLIPAQIWVREQYIKYLELVDFRDEIKAEVMRLTLKMYS